MYNIIFIDIALLAGNDIRKSCAICVVVESVIMQHVRIVDRFLRIFVQ